MQQAWQTQNMDKVKHLVTPELYQNYQLMLTEMKKKGERNFIKDIEFTDINIISCEDFKDNSKDRYVDHIKGTTGLHASRTDQKDHQEPGSNPRNFYRHLPFCTLQQ